MQAILRAVFNKAYREYWITDNTYTRMDWKQPKFVNMFCADADVSERGYSNKETRKIAEFLKTKHEKNPSYLPAYALELQIIMGLRRGEVPPLRFSDIDYENGYIRIIREQLTIKKSLENPKEYFQIVEHTKTWKDRRYPLTNDLLDFLKMYKKYMISILRKVFTCFRQKWMTFYLFTALVTVTKMVTTNWDKKWNPACLLDS